MRLIAPYIDELEQQSPEWAMRSLYGWLERNCLLSDCVALARKGEPIEAIHSSQIAPEEFSPIEARLFPLWAAAARVGVEVPLVWLEDGQFYRCMFTLLPEPIDLDAFEVVQAA